MATHPRMSAHRFLSDVPLPAAHGAGRRAVHRVRRRLSRAPDRAVTSPARSIERRELVGIRARAGRERCRGGRPARRRCIASVAGVGAFAPHQLVEQRAVERQERGALLGARRVVARTASPSQSRTAATPRTATGVGPRRPQTNRAGGEVAEDASRAPPCRTRPAARRDTSRRGSGTTGTPARPAADPSALRRCSQSGMRRRGLPRGRRSARAAFIRNRAPNSDVLPTSSTTRRSRLGRLAARRIAFTGSGAAEVGEAQHDAVVGGLHLNLGQCPPSSPRSPFLPASDSATRWRAPCPTARSRVRRTARAARAERHPTSSRKCSRTSSRSSGTDAATTARCSRT